MPFAPIFGDQAPLMTALPWLGGPPAVTVSMSGTVPAKAMDRPWPVHQVTAVFMVKVRCTRSTLRMQACNSDPSNAMMSPATTPKPSEK